MVPEQAGLSGASEAPAPPRPPFVLSVGVTGHRAEVLPADSIPALRARIRELLALITEAAAALKERAGDIFAEGEPLLRLVSPVADGADQITAEAALELGWELQEILPFARSRYRGSLANEGERFDELLEKASCILELPGEDGHELEAYVMTGRATVAHCDMLIAVWDGLPPRGRGGTGEVVQGAITHGTAVVHVPPEPDRAARILWSAFDPTVVTVADDPSVQRPADRESFDILLEGLLMPPPDPYEIRFLKKFYREQHHRIRARIEYPLLLAIAGVRRLGTKDIAEKHAAAYIRDEWRQFRERCVDAHPISAPIGLLEEAYSWADRLATHFAQTYRSGHIFNFVLGGAAVCLGLSAFMAPHLKLEFAIAEMMITIAILLNAHIGTRNEWHRRWLDYRQLAERLRPMRSLKMLAIAAPDPPGTATNPVPRRWIDWYASGIWRGMGCPAGTLDRSQAALLAESIADQEVAPQVAYHQRNARVIHLLDERLARAGFSLFAVTLFISVVTLVSMALDATWFNNYGNWLTLISAGFPALGTAVFGIRFQGDFGGDALRSLATADTLKHIEMELREKVTLSRAADLTEQAARVMLADLDEWRLVNQQRDLSVG